MNILKRIKDGASRVSEKAQSSVEIGKLNGHISDIEHEMEIEFMKMGKLFYEGYRSRDMSEAEGKMVELSRGCFKLQEQIDELRARIAGLKNEQLCACGQVVTLGANFCPHCGRKLEPAPSLRKEEPAVNVHIVHKHEEEEDEYYGEEELTEAEKELAMRHDLRASNTEKPPVKEELPPEYFETAQEEERGRREADELERERERQLELDRRIRDWRATEPEEEAAVSEGGVRELVKCQICRADLPKGSMWCPRCGSEQI